MSGSRLSISRISGAFLAGAALLMGSGTAELKAQEIAAVDPAALSTFEARVPVPVARPVRAGELPMTGVFAIAQQYTQFQSAVTEAIQSSLGTPGEVRRMLDKLRFSEPGDVARGWLAHRGLIAAQDPAFAEGVRRAVSRHGAISVLQQLSGKGTFARSLPGANSAVAAVMTEIEADNRRMTLLHERFLTAAHTFQGNRWGMLERPEDAAANFASADSATDTDKGVMAGLASALEAFSPITPAHALAQPLMERVLAYGARHVIATSLDTDASLADIAPPSRRTTSCLNWAKLNLNQCIAAAHFPSEEAWCTGKHAIEDVRACWAQVLPKADR